MRTKYVCHLTLISVVPSVTNSQGMLCSESCPPINSQGSTQTLCPGDLSSSMVNSTDTYNACYFQNKSFQLNDFKNNGQVTVLADHSMCEVGMLESRTFARIANYFYSAHGSNSTFIQSIRGSGETCKRWAESHQVFTTSVSNNASTVPLNGMVVPLIIYDLNGEVRNALFSEEINYPSYIILDGDLRVRYKFNSPCCGHTCNSCTISKVMELDEKLSNYVNSILAENVDINKAAMNKSDAVKKESCIIGNWSDWSPRCCQAHSIVKLRFRTVEGINCPSSIEMERCNPKNDCESTHYRYKGINFTSDKGGIVRVVVFLVLVILLPISYSMVLKRIKNRNNINEGEGEEEATVISEKDSDDDSV